MCGGNPCHQGQSPQTLGVLRASTLRWPCLTKTRPPSTESDRSLRDLQTKLLWTPWCRIMSLRRNLHSPERLRKWIPEKVNALFSYGKSFISCPVSCFLNALRISPLPPSHTDCLNVAHRPGPHFVYCGRNGVKWLCFPHTIRSLSIVKQIHHLFNSSCIEWIHPEFGFTSVSHLFRILRCLYPPTILWMSTWLDIKFCFTCQPHTVTVSVLYICNQQKRHLYFLSY